MHTIPHFNGKGCRPYLEILETHEDLIEIYSGKSDPTMRKYRDEQD